jgi:hypothetical protein
MEVKLNKQKIKKLKTGDIILFSGTKTLFDRAIEYVTKTPYSHIGIILKNPTFIDPSLNNGIYFWESGIESFPDPSTNKKPLGVRLSLFKDVYESCKKEQNMYFRRILYENPIKEKKLLEIYDVVKNKPYDLNIIDWVCAAFKIKIPRTTDRFWCSAFVGYIFWYLKFLNDDIDWTIMRPSDFSSNYSHTKFDNCSFTKEILITDDNINNII